MNFKFQISNCKLVGCAIAIVLSSCTGTVAPKPVQAARTSDWAQRNVIAANSKGVLVTGEWVRAYQEMLKEEGSKLPVSNRPGSPNDGITAEGNNFRVTYEVSDRFADLKYFERNGSP